MIESAVITYLNNHADLVAYKGKIYYHRAPTDVSMPWAILNNAGGSRPKITKQKREPWDTLIIDVYHEKQFEGLTMAQKISAALDLYRGDMGVAKDTYFQCDTIRDLDSFFAGFRYLITCRVKYIIPVVTNQH